MLPLTKEHLSNEDIIILPKAVSLLEGDYYTVFYLYRP